VMCEHSWHRRIVVQGPAHWWCVRCAAIATEARRAETGTGSVHEGAGRKASPSPVSDHPHHKKAE
jgi:hypothetical protein